MLYSIPSMPVPIPPDAKEVFRGELLRLYQWKLKLYDGNEGQYEFVVRPDTAQVLAFINRDTILITKQEQPHRGASFYDLPGGRIDDGESMEKGVRRELIEETGQDAKRWLEWERTQMKGMYRYEQGLYLATDIYDVPDGRHLDAGEKIEVIHMPFKDVVKLALKRELRSFEAMLCILQIAYDPAAQDRLDTFLSARA